MYSGSDYKTQVIVIPGHSTVPLEQFRHRISEADLNKFIKLVNNGVAQLSNL